ncbi:Proteasome subunit beta type, partial [Operophtera brumata]
MSNLNLQCLLGIQCNDFVMIAADQSNAHSIMLMKDDEEKIYKISEKLVMGVNGDSGDTNQFAEYIAKNIQLYKMRNDATEEEAYEILKKCVTEVHKRLFVSLPNFQVTVVNRDGIKAMP